MIKDLPRYAGKPKRRENAGPSPFVLECQRLMEARIKATSPAEKEDAEWALNYAMSMHRAGRFDEYLSLLAEQQVRRA